MAPPMTTSARRRLLHGPLPPSEGRRIRNESRPSPVLGHILEMLETETLETILETLETTAEILDIHKIPENIGPESDNGCPHHRRRIRRLRS
jgi:hypothetical protein